MQFSENVIWKVPASPESGKWCFYLCRTDIAETLGVGQGAIPMDLSSRISSVLKSWISWIIVSPLLFYKSKLGVDWVAFAYSRNKCLLAKYVCFANPVNWVQNSRALVSTVGLVSPWSETRPVLASAGLALTSEIGTLHLLELQRPELWGSEVPEKKMHPCLLYDYLFSKLRDQLLQHPPYLFLRGGLISIWMYHLLQQEWLVPK